MWHRFHDQLTTIFNNIYIQETGGFVYSEAWRMSVVSFTTWSHCYPISVLDSWLCIKTRSESTQATLRDLCITGDKFTISLILWRLAPPDIIFLVVASITVKASLCRLGSWKVLYCHCCVNEKEYGWGLVMKLLQENECQTTECKVEVY